jgi:hypothetical protein
MQGEQEERQGGRKEERNEGRRKEGIKGGREGGRKVELLHRACKKNLTDSPCEVLFCSLLLLEYPCSL